jgi:hypothetical protein
MATTGKCLDQEHGTDWTVYHGDCVEVVKGLPENSIDFSVFSPPFASLYVYSNSERDMGNSAGYEEFWEHFEYLATELYRVIKTGRLISIHCMNYPTTKQRDGNIGLRDFRGDVIRLFRDAGFIFHSEVCIWKDPVVQMQRTKSIGLLHKQVKKDSCMSRQAIPDYVVTFRKPGVNQDPVAGEFDHFAGVPFRGEGNLSIDIWQRYASPVWSDINPSNTLQYRSARDSKDERHICPLQLDVIERCLQLWSNPGDTVLSPFAGIGSEGYVSIKQQRKYIGVELKDSYFRSAASNLRTAESEMLEGRLF